MIPAPIPSPSAETFGLTHNQDCLAAKLRNMPADLLAVLIPTTTRDILLPTDKERE